MVSSYTDQSRDGNIALSLGPRFSGVPERIGKIAMPISASRPHAVDDLMIGRLGASISRMWGSTGSEFGVAVLNTIYKNAIKYDQLKFIQIN